MAIPSTTIPVIISEITKGRSPSEETFQELSESQNTSNCFHISEISDILLRVMVYSRKYLAFLSADEGGPLQYARLMMVEANLIINHFIMNPQC